MRLDHQAWIWHGGRPCRAWGVQKGPGTCSRGGRGGCVCKIGCAKVSPMTEKKECSDALGCPEWGPLAAIHRECVLGNWHQLPCFRGSLLKIHAYTFIVRAYTSYTYTYIHIRTYTISVRMCPYKRIMFEYTYKYVHIRAYTIIETVLDP